ncbi:hypothetical protein Caur_3662 [Chloroflexus aurantiacus J-10-fl]|jgi:hypothetical protein|uniref:Uncharacterized protein n=1 Tax=Chloroflexus aurantiacus (strain ATCC 29366 / DSM 635 / J-10-fl) TaxID=324602 RepID=A9WB52_CHLAA|nr:hypothetical protein [Chloroflexus aurantiacus]ABY36845.1 hypothetical protein Caur_3662 [Chloroflexus aurantiacus J-10-fl]
MWRSAGSGPVNPQDLNRSAYALNNPLPATDPTGHLPLLPVPIAGGLALLKAIDDGWTAWDAVQATHTLADPQASVEEKRAAAANLTLTAALEAAEPDDLLPVALPLDDLLRVGIIGGTKGAGKSLPAAYEITKAGGRHAGVLKNYFSRRSAEIERALRSLERQAALHRDKLANPAQYAEKWETMTAKDREDLLRYWHKEATNYAEQADVLRGLLMERGQGGP